MDGNFEAVISGRRESSSGIFITLQVNPADVTADLAMLRVGASLMIGWAEVVDATVHKIEVKPTADEKKKERMKFGDFPLSKQAAIRCGDRDFIAFLNASYLMLPDDFDPAQAVKDICRVASRKEFDTDAVAAFNWRTMEDNFQRWLTDQRYADVKR